MKVSVIVPAWGDTPYLDRAIESVSKREDLELIVSKPSVEFSNSALSARMEGVGRAKGEYLMFLDADDTLTDGAVELLLEHVSDDVDVVAGAMVRGTVKNVCEERPFSLIGPSDVYNSFCAKLIKRDLFENITVDYSIRNGEDLLVMAQVFAKAQRIEVIDKIVYRYIANSGSITKSMSAEEKARDLLKVDEVLLRVLNADSYAALHNRILRDAMLLLLRARMIGGVIWKEARSRMTESPSADVRHGMLKRFALYLSCQFERLFA